MFTVKNLLFLMQEGSGLLLCVLTINEDDYSSKALMAVDLILLVTRIYTITIVIYYCINCLVISDLFKSIRREIDCITNKSNQQTINDAITDRLQIIANKYQHIICHCFGLLNDSFGPILLFEMLYIFIGITNQLMRIMVEIKDFSGDLFVFSRLTHTFFIANFLSTLCLICYSAENISRQV